MNWIRSGLTVALAGLLVMLPASAQDQAPPTPKHDNQVLRDTLKEVINTGAELFNKSGDHAGCYRLYQGALLAIKPFLGGEMQKEIEGSLTEAEKLPRFSDRAFALRKTINNIRGLPASKMP